MQVELRSDGLHINGYVNVPGRESRPFTHGFLGRIVEVIEQRAFGRAIERANRIDMLLDHDNTRRVASTEDGTLKVYEDEVGLRAESIITDEEAVQAAKDGKIKGWSFNMFNIVDYLEKRADAIPLRHIKDFNMSEITLVIDKIPVYKSTSVEVRAGEELTIEERAGIDSEVEEEESNGLESIESEQEPEQEHEEEEAPKDTVDYSTYEATVKLLRTQKEITL